MSHGTDINESLSWFCLQVVMGLGRSGLWFSYQHYGIQPDIVTMAKGV